MSAVVAVKHRRRADAFLVPALDALLEGGWIAVVDAALAATSGTHPLGPLPFALLAFLSLVWVRSSPDRTTTYIGLGVLYVAGVAGAGLLGGGSPGSAGVLANLAQSSALLGALAVFRGSRHLDAQDDDLTVGNVLQFGFPLLALPWLYGASLAAAARATFVEAAFPATLLFGTAGLFALGLSRLDALTASSGLDWRRNRPWLVLLVGVLAVMTVIAVPASFLLGTPITSVVGGLLGPLAILLSPVAAVLGEILKFFLGFLDPLVAWLQSMMTAHPVIQDPGQGLPFGSPPPIDPGAGGDTSGTGAILVSIMLVTAALIVLAIVVRLTFRQPAARITLPDEPFEEREYRLPGVSLHLPHFSRPKRRPGPTTAGEAYLAFLGLLDARPDLARGPAEPPATHAARLRAGGFGDRRAGMLAADYQLERYGLVEISPAERRRAIGRWSALRDVLRRP